MLLWPQLLLLLLPTSSTSSSTPTFQFHLQQHRDTVFPAVPLHENVQLYYLERVLASWVLSSAPWNAYHSAIGFKFEQTNIQAYVEYIPELTDHVKWVLHPQLVAKDPNASSLYTWYMNAYDIIWNNQGGVQFSRTRMVNTWLQEGMFENATFIGTLTSHQFNELRKWIFDYQDKHTTFEPVEIFDPVQDMTISPSIMCHDMFYHAMDYLVDHLQFIPQPSGPIFRDHIVVFAQSLELMHPHTNARDARAITRYFRLFTTFMNKISIEFTAIRGLLITAVMLGIEPIMYRNKHYYRVRALQSPYVNYCYMEISLPPHPRASLSSSVTLCALENQMLGVTNQTAYVWENLSSQHVLYALETMAESVGML